VIKQPYSEALASTHPDTQGGQRQCRDTPDRIQRAAIDPDKDQTERHTDEVAETSSNTSG